MNVSSHILPSSLEQAAKLFSAMLKRNRVLWHLDLARNELGTQAGIALAGALRVNSALAYLSLAGNGMGPKAAKAMAQALAENRTLTGVDFADNILGVATAEGGDPADVGLALGLGLRRYEVQVPPSAMGYRVFFGVMEGSLQKIGKAHARRVPDFAKRRIDGKTSTKK